MPTFDSTKNAQVQVNNGGRDLVIGPSGTMTDLRNRGEAGPSGVTLDERTQTPNVTVLTIDKVVTMTDAGAAGSHGSLELYDLPAGIVAFDSIVTDLHLVAGAGGIGDAVNVVAGIGTAQRGTDNATLTGTEQDLVPSTACLLAAGVGNFDVTARPQGGALPGLTALTDSSGGTANDTIAALTDLATGGGNTYTDAAVNAKLAIIRDGFADLAAKVNALIGSLGGFDGSITPKKMWLNLVVANADSSANDTLTVTGTVTVKWRLL